ncbi:hypothetical protein [Namhaeicola litoreus]|uniref:Nuclear transport factor 2 family protein n=1 Tax=Namhaeicola litoreus TaxID=1052145 RepID=A0ABW3Y332_9FLAO
MYSTLIEKIGDLNDLIIQGKVLEAFDAYYHDEVHIQFTQDFAIQGKTENRKNKEHFLDGISEWRSAQPLKVSIGEGITMVEWLYDFKHKTDGDRRETYVAVQEWKEGKIIKEKLYYNP